MISSFHSCPFHSILSIPFLHSIVLLSMVQFLASTSSFIHLFSLLPIPWLPYQYYHNCHQNKCFSCLAMLVHTLPLTIFYLPNLKHQKFHLETVSNKPFRDSHQIVRSPIIPSICSLQLSAPSKVIEMSHSS